MTNTAITTRPITVSYNHPVFGPDIITIPAGTHVEAREDTRRPDRARIRYGTVHTQTVTWNSIRPA